MSRRILKNLIDLATGTLVSRVFGFLRELITAAYYGTHRAMDLFVIAFTIPAFFRQVLGEDVVERAFMPPFKTLISQKKYAKGWRLLSSCLNLMIFVLLILTAVLYLLAPLIVKMIAPGLAEDLLPQAVTMTYWIIPFMFIIGIAAFAGGILNFFEMNKIYSLAPAMMSVGVIIGVHFFRSFLGIYALPAGFLLGAIMVVAVQLPFLFAKKIHKDTQARYYPGLQIHDPEMQRVGRESGFIFLKSLLDKSVEIVDRILASFLITGSISSLWFAHRLILLPVAIIGLAISRSLIPYLTEKKALIEDRKFLEGITLGIELNFTLVLPTIMFMVVMAKPIISFVYQRGEFDAESTRLTAIAFWCYSAGLLGLSLNAFLSRIFSIFQKNRIPFYVAIFSATLNIGLNFLLVRTSLKHGGIALASSIAFTMSGIVLFYFLLRQLNFELNVRQIVSDLIKLTVLSAVIGLVCHRIYFVWLEPFFSRNVASLFLRNAIGLSVVAVISLAIYGVALFLWGPEMIKSRLKAMNKKSVLHL
ncbi:MAG: murein biosynthesis integral membrane protein MurJ [Calditrichaeota bacterium]|nr:murein biosynthesis integral membrane protein MurJ [Calditrichota bacterium]